MKRRLEPRPAKALVLVQQASRALEQGQLAEAAALAERALTLEPKQPEVLFAVGSLALEGGDAASAERFFEQALALRRTSVPADWWLALARASRDLGHLDKVARALKGVVATLPKSGEAWASLAQALQGLGDLPGAARALERLLELTGDRWQWHNDLGATLMELRDFDAAERAFQRAQQLNPDEPRIWANRASLLGHRGEPAEALALFERCASAHPEFAPGVAGLGFALRDAGRFDEARAALGRARTLTPDDYQVVCGLGRVLLESGDASGALGIAREYLALHPGHSGALSLLSLAYLGVGDERGAQEMFDYERFVSMTKLPAPAGFETGVAFNTALTLHTLAHPTLVTAPVSHATSRGQHSGSLLVAPKGPIAALERAVAEAARDYGRAHSEPKRHPFVRHRPERVFLKMWCVVLRAGGFQSPHIHPWAWLSGVYYPKVPVTMGEAPSGFLEFGAADRVFPAKLPTPTLSVKPEEGRLVLFPSYLYHHTIPFDGDATRISIAFDVTPAPSP